MKFRNIFPQSFMKQQKGQSLTEYAVVLSLVAVAAISVMAFFGAALKSKVAAITGAIAGHDKKAVSQAEKQAAKASDKAAAASQQVDGMRIGLDGDASEVIDSVQLK